MRTSFKSRAVVIAAVLALAFGASGCSADESGAANSTSAATRPDRALTDSVNAMYEAVADGDYVKAYSYRSENCRSGIRLDEYKTAMATLYDWRDLRGRPDPRFTTVVTDLSQDSAKVQVVFYDVPGAMNDDKSPRRWIREGGRWLYDQCTTSGE